MPASLQDGGHLTGSGHARAAAATGLAFLACHPLGARGDDCLVGPYRPALLRAGALGGLLRCALRSDAGEVRGIVEQAAAVGVMYLATMVRW